MSPRTFAHLLLVWSLTLILLSCGAYFSLQPEYDPLWLTRAGCTVVMLGIISSISVMLETKLLNRTHNLQKRIAKLNILRKYPGPAQHANQLVLEMEAEKDLQLAKRSERLQFNFTLLEASLLLIGTFSWGFGDLIQHFR